MDLDLTDEQAALVNAVQRLLADFDTIPPEHRRASHYYGHGLDEMLAANGFTDPIGNAGLGPLEAALVATEVARMPSVVEIAASSLVAPQFSQLQIPRPIALASNGLNRPIRFLPVAKSVLLERNDRVWLVEVDPVAVEAVSSIFGYPYGKFLAPPDPSKMVDIGPAEILRRWSQIALAAEAAGAMRSAVAFTVDYVKNRHLFGTTIAHFQAVQHRLAHAHRVAEATQILVMKAAWSGETFDALQAASFAQQHIPQLTFDLHQFNGAMGVSFEHLLHFWTYRLKALQSEMGGANAAALRTADLLWGPAEKIA